jgi:hypothetical protein
MVEMSQSRVAACVQLILANNAGNAICRGVSPRPLPDNGPFPYITVQEPTDRKLLTLTGPTGISESFIQFNCWSKDYEEANTSREALKIILDDYSGAAGSRVIDSSDHNLDTELYDGDRELHQLITRYHIWWED